MLEQARRASQMVTADWSPVTPFPIFGIENQRNKERCNSQRCSNGMLPAGVVWRNVRNCACCLHESTSGRNFFLALPSASERHNCSGSRSAPTAPCGSRVPRLWYTSYSAAEPVFREEFSL